MIAMLVILGISVVITGLIEWRYQVWCRKHGFNPGDIFG